jgi:gluconokinase
MTPPCVPPRILLLMGVSGAGKTTTAQRLARRLDWPFRDADSFHPPANIAKMRSGLPLTDVDRWPWLDAIAAYMDEQIAAGRSAIVTCSALKKAYRDRLLTGRRDARLVYLKGEKQLIASRLERRRNHFMPPGLLTSQFDTLEEPRASERAIVVNVAMPPKRVVDRILTRCGLAPTITIE